MEKIWFSSAAGMLAGVFCIGGCQESLPKLYPVEIELLQDGKPVAQGGLIFQPEKPVGRGIVYNAEHVGQGVFKGRILFHSAEGTKVLPGVATGTYRIVYHPPSDGQKTNLEVALNDSLTVGKEPAKVRLELPKVVIESQILEPPEEKIGMGLDKGK